MSAADGGAEGSASGRPQPGAEADPSEKGHAPPVIVVTGLSGAGRTTAINVLEDLGHEPLNNFPLALFDAVIAPMGGSGRPLAIGIETRTRGFSAGGLIGKIQELRSRWDRRMLLIFLDCADDVLISRFSQTRRRHPLAPAEDPSTGVARERDILREVRAHADIVIDTSALTPHQLRAELESRFGAETFPGLVVSVQSFSYKRGVPPGADMVQDCRFLRNPYWDEALRALDGRAPLIQDFVTADARYGPFFEKLTDLVLMLLPAYKDEGKAYFSIALGCTGGRHRSVSVAEKLALRLSEAGWPVSIHHRELAERDRQTSDTGAGA